MMKPKSFFGNMRLRTISRIYFPRGESFLSTLAENIPHWLSSKQLRQTGVVIFGAGSGGRFLAEYFSRAGIAIHAFLDNFCTASLCEGRPIFRPTARPDTIEVDSGVPVILSVTNFSPYGGDTHNDCRMLAKNAGWKHIAWRPEWLAALFHEHVADIDRVREALADGKSRSVYEQCLRFLSRRDMSDAPMPETDMYFARDVFSPVKPLRWIQGGSFTGDTFQSALKNGIPIEAGAFFEPDPENFRKLTTCISATPISVSCWPCGLWSELAVFRFHSGKGADSYLDPDGDRLIQCVDGDSALSNFHPNFVTLDVEGAEVQALKGMERLIVSERPILAVSMYHRPDDWWRIPGMLMDIVKANSLGYTWFIRAHGDAATDVVLYAIPS